MQRINFIARELHSFKLYFKCLHCVRTGFSKPINIYQFDNNVPFKNNQISFEAVSCSGGCEFNFDIAICNNREKGYIVVDPEINGATVEIIKIS